MRKITIILSLLIFMISCKTDNIKKYKNHPETQMKNKNKEEFTGTETITDSLENEIAKAYKNDFYDSDGDIPEEYSSPNNEKSMKHLAENEFTEGLYVSAFKVKSKSFPALLDSASGAGLNTVVFDLKNMDGNIFFDFDDKKLKLPHNKLSIINIPETVEMLHEKGFRAVARMVMFHDIYIAGEDSSFCPRLKTGKRWVESKRKKPSWLDSSHPLVQRDLLELISQAASQGVDEIQMDYVRFPTQGKIKDAIFYFQTEDSLKILRDSTHIRRKKYDIIKEFCRKAEIICDRYDVDLTADVFAISSWQRRVDVENTGQKFSFMTKHLSKIHPMVYSSHFSSNFGYRENVENEPYDILYKAVSLTDKNSEKDCKVIPYIQANSWKVNYTPEYVAAQITAIKNAKGKGYLLWNAQSKYFKTLRWIKNWKKANGYLPAD